MEYSVSEDVMGQIDMSGHGMNHNNIDDIITSVSKAVHIEEENLPDPIEFLKKVMDKRGLRNKDMKVYIGSSGNVCSVLKRRKPLSIRMIRNLHKYLHIPADILIQPYDCH